MCQVRPVKQHRADSLRCCLMQVQSTTRLCLTRDLNEHDVVSRIMRKENYLIGMLNKGCLALHVSMPGMRKRFILSETLKWNLLWSVGSPAGNGPAGDVCSSQAMVLHAWLHPLRDGKMKSAQTCCSPLRHAGLQRQCGSFVQALVGCCSLGTSGLQPDRDIGLRQIWLAVLHQCCRCYLAYHTCT